MTKYPKYRTVENEGIAQMKHIKGLIASATFAAQRIEIYNVVPSATVSTTITSLKSNDVQEANSVNVWEDMGWEILRS